MIGITNKDSICNTSNHWITRAMYKEHGKIWQELDCDLEMAPLQNAFLFQLARILLEVFDTTGR